MKNKNLVTITILLLMTCSLLNAQYEYLADYSSSINGNHLQHPVQLKNERFADAIAFEDLNIDALYSEIVVRHQLDCHYSPNETLDLEYYGFKSNFEFAKLKPIEFLKSDELEFTLPSGEIQIVQPYIIMIQGNINWPFMYNSQPIFWGAQEFFTIIKYFVDDHGQVQIIWQNSFGSKEDQSLDLGVDMVSEAMIVNNVDKNIYVVGNLFNRETEFLGPDNLSSNEASFIFKIDYNNGTLIKKHVFWKEEGSKLNSITQMYNSSKMAICGHIGPRGYASLLDTDLILSRTIEMPYPAQGAIVSNPKMSFADLTSHNNNLYLIGNYFVGPNYENGGYFLCNYDLNLNIIGVISMPFHINPNNTHSGYNEIGHSIDLHSYTDNFNKHHEELVVSSVTLSVNSPGGSIQFKEYNPSYRVFDLNSKPIRRYFIKEEINRDSRVDLATFHIDPRDACQQGVKIAFDVNVDNPDNILSKAMQLVDDGDYGSSCLKKSATTYRTIHPPFNPLTLFEVVLNDLISYQNVLPTKPELIKTPVCINANSHKKAIAPSDSKFSHFNLYSLSGQFVMTKEASEYQNFKLHSTLQAGIYLAQKIKIDGSFDTEKIYIGQ